MGYRAVACIILILLLCSASATGVTVYVDGSPQLSAAVNGTNEFTPNEDATISVTVQNSGLNTFKFVTKGTIERDDLPTTAKLVTIGLSAGTAPLEIRTDPQMVGDIRAAGMVTVRFSVRISADAPAGDYYLPLIIWYKYLGQSDQEASDTLRFIYTPVNQTVLLLVRIKPQVKIAVLEATPESLSAGTEGYLDLKIRNTGSEDGRKATVAITRNGQSPVIPTDSSVFVGDFPGGGVISCRYKVAVSAGARKQTYPVDVAVTYENAEGNLVTSAPYTVGVPVGSKTEFVIASEPARITAGSKGEVVVEYENRGESTVRDAQARISAVDPFSSNDDTAYLGSLEPGGKATAWYKVSVNSAAEPGIYLLNTEIRYRDALGNSQVSDTLKMAVEVAPPTGSGSPLANPLAACLIAAVVAGAGYYLLVMRRKK
jgi:hypothetical protein